MQSERASVSMTLETTSVISYAMAHNEVSVINRLVVDGVDDDVVGAVVRFDVVDANGPLAEPHSRTLDLPGGRPVVLTDLRLALDPLAMARVEEQRPGVIRVWLEVDGVRLAEASVRVRVLAARQWSANPLALGLEMLAAHVMPNHPAVVELMGHVADRLLVTTGSPSLQGYQAGPERVDDIVRAVFDVLRTRAIRYSEPPASWADEGQKVRTPGEVLEDRVGTCLDLVVVMAAALEQAGVSPLLWLVEGHAFLGYWREDSALDGAAQTDVGDVVNLVDLGRIRLVETVLATVRADAPSFADSHRPPYDAYLTGGLDRVLGVVDVHQARRDRVVPLPARTTDDQGNAVVSFYTPTARFWPEVAAVARPGAGPRHAAPPPPRVAQWKNALLDLSLRNRLVNFSARAGLPLVVPGDRLGALEDVLHEGAAVALRASDEMSAVDRERGVRAGRDLPPDQLVDLLVNRRTVYADVTEAAYRTRLRGVAHKARTVLEETGANNLYLALGSLVWEFDGRALRSPLVLVPVTLTPSGRGGRYQLRLDESGSSTPNYCLVEKLRQVHGLEVPGLAEPALDDAGIDLDAAFRATREAVAERGLPFRVEPTADLAVLQFAKFRLWKDLDENWSAFTANPLVDHLVRTPADAFVDPVATSAVHDLEELAEKCPVPADASQLKAVAEAVAGRTFVLEGPPGTGKSQTITNLLVHAVAEGKKVLFVAEKRAALDVVRRRLDAVGMGPLCLDLHDKGSSPVAVREQVRRALEHVVASDPPGLAARLDELRSARRALTRYAYELHDRNPVGLSLYSARDAVLAIGEGVEAMPVSSAFLATASSDTANRMRKVLTDLPDVAYPVRPRPDHPWAFLDDFRGPVVAEVLPAARRADAALRALTRHEVVRAVREPEDLRSLAALLADRTPLGVLDEVRTTRWAQAVDGVRRQVAEFAVLAHPGLDVVTPAVLDLPVADVHAAARAAAASRFWGRRKRLVAVRDRLEPVLRPGAGVAPKRVVELTGELVALREGVDRLAASVRQVPGLVLPAGWNPLTAEGREHLVRRVEWLRWAASVVDPADPVRGRFAGPARAFLVTGAVLDPAPLVAAAAAVDDLAKACRITVGAIAEWAAEPGLVATWVAGAVERQLGDDRLGSLHRWLALLVHLEPLRDEHLDDARSLVLRGEVDPDGAVRSFELGLAEASVRERGRATGLRSFDPAAHERGIARFVSVSGMVREHLRTAVPQQVVRGREFDPAATGGRVGLLRRQLNRQRGGLRVRELMIQFGDLVTAAMPCVLVSPDSVARFFPATSGQFDIVVFDEASQVRVADAVGAMGRARSVVVVGDSRQMPPTSFMESAFDPEALGDAVEDEESILTECVQARVPRQRLAWHYRSQDESLIAFSNHHYYDGALASFPAPGTRPDRGVSLVRVDGTFHRSGEGGPLRTNPVEAEAVVAEIRRRFDASPDAVPSIGVVTFNQQQRTCVEALLRDSGDPRIAEALESDVEGLFVKNLENVQGDERDVVLFSTAFSVDKRGVLPLNFGPLNRVGGERRLNVAVTRARRQVVVFSSFAPEQLRAEETSSVGVRHLRTYLDMAAGVALPASSRWRAVVDRHRDEVASALRAAGLVVTTDVGLSEFRVDLALADPATPDAPVVAVLLDGPGWASRLTVRDRDGLPVEVLRGRLGWPAVRRVWLPDWLDEPAAVVARLVAAVREPVVAPEPVREPPVPATVPVPVGVGVAVPDHASVFVPWAERVAGPVGVLDALPAPAAAASVAAVVGEVVRVEGPVHVDRLVRLVAGAFGLTRVAGPRRAAILEVVGDLVVEHDVVWPAGMRPGEWSGFRRTPEGVERPFEHVPVREVVNALVSVARGSGGMPLAELRREVLGIFGGRRVTAGVGSRLDAAVEFGVRGGRLRVDPDDTVVAVQPTG
ncbi:DUF3320 domain-containing protein [Umezawaea tangerina]|uniref:AAA domain-containing protein n=1 Tax=Umezawaea tangerina TaxID=84725 RepID=A0A2T0SN46_9PSEU|nr:DUF3320 domain-containing protein [Umezawaea tangerina]PRY34837.1 AAA domain-containing protein [Umezawaea tangerina]